MSVSTVVFSPVYLLTLIQRVPILGLKTMYPCSLPIH